MQYRRMPIEIESPEEIGAGTIRYNLAESDLAASQNADGSINAAKIEAAKTAFRQLEQSPKSDAEAPNRSKSPPGDTLHHLGCRCAWSAHDPATPTDPKRH